MMRSTRRALAGCAAGHSCRLREAGTARASADTQDSVLPPLLPEEPPPLLPEELPQQPVGRMLPAAQPTQVPEQAALERPARSP